MGKGSTVGGGGAYSTPDPIKRYRALGGQTVPSVACANRIAGEMWKWRG